MSDDYGDTHDQATGDRSEPLSPAAGPCNRRKACGYSCTHSAERLGKLVFHIVGALAEFGHDLSRERTTAGMTAAKNLASM